jgi:hypothetical protein
MTDPFNLAVLLVVGIKLPLLIAGTAGGIVVNAFVFRKSSPIAVVNSLVASGCMGNYLGEPAAHFISSTIDPLPSAFIVGACAMPICQALIAAAQKWSPTVPGEKT